MALMLSKCLGTGNRHQPFFGCCPRGVRETGMSHFFGVGMSLFFQLVPRGVRNWKQACPIFSELPRVEFRVEFPSILGDNRIASLALRTRANPCRRLHWRPPGALGIRACRAVHSEQLSTDILWLAPQALLVPGHQIHPDMQLCKRKACVAVLCLKSTLMRRLDSHSTTRIAHASIT